MKNAAWKQVALEHALRFPSFPNGVAAIPGDSSLMVNRYGERVVNEKLNYNQRAQVHFDWDAEEYQYRNQLLFMIYDARTGAAFAGSEPIPPVDGVHPEVISVDRLDAMGPAIDARLREFEERTLRFRLADDFGERLAETVSRFNRYSRKGVDPEFRRGETLHEGAFHGPRRAGNDMPNPMMYPLSETGPYHAIILAAGTFGTRGGPEIDPHARVLHADGHAIPGLYGAGNCIASPAAGGYWGGRRPDRPRDRIWRNRRTPCCRGARPRMDLKAHVRHYVRHHSWQDAGQDAEPEEQTTRGASISVLLGRLHLFEKGSSPLSKGFVMTAREHGTCAGPSFDKPSALALETR
jgi:hypothetical protein